MTLTLRPKAATNRFLGGDHTYLYEVDELPPGHRASIGENGMSHRWQILRTIDGNQGDWMGRYRSAEDALGALQMAPTDV
jgi:hypothetical protein